MPPPFNVVPSPKSLFYVWHWLQRRLCGHARAKREHMRTIRVQLLRRHSSDFTLLLAFLRISTYLKVFSFSEKSETGQRERFSLPGKRSINKRTERYDRGRELTRDALQAIMRNLVRRYVTVQQRRAESGGVTEDDVNEIKQDVSAFRCELVEILRNSGMNTSTANAGAPGERPADASAPTCGTSLTHRSATGGGGGKKNRQKERRLMKGFNIAPSGQLAPVDEFLASLHHEHGGAHGASHHPLSALLGAAGGRLRNSQSSLSDAPSAQRRNKPHKRRWGTIIDAARAARVSRLIGRSRSEDSVCDNARQSPR